MSSVTDANTRSLHFNLREYSTDSLLIDDVFKNADIERWKIDSTKLYLHLESLDEALLRIDTVANLLGRRFKSIPKDRLFVRIACRTALWPELTLEPAMQAIWGDEAVTVLELAPLRRFDAEAIARSAGVDVEGFLAEVTRAELAAFAHKPLTLHFLIALFKKDGRLPSSTSDLYRLGCRQLCDEKSPSRRDASRLDGRYLGRLGVEQRLTVASRIAAVTMLANRYAIWTGAETDATPESDVTLAALSGGTELAGSTDFEVSETAVREVLDTGLFSARGNSRMGWAHQSYAEFLAAEYLVGKKTPSGKIVRLLTHPNGGLTPQLANVAAWAASLDSNVRKELIAREPLAMLAGDLSLWNDADLSELTKAVIRNYNEQRVFGFRIGLHNALARLKHDGLSALLRTAISDMSLSGPARAIACAIAGACSASELEGDLMGLALDAKEEPQLRVAALSALGKIGEPGNWGALKALADGDAGPDPQQELKGKALTLLWPKSMSAEDVFARLVLPNPGYVGSYLMFVTEALPEGLTPDGIPLALEWIEKSVPPGGTLSFSMERLQARLFALAWEHVEQSTIANALIDAMIARLQDGGSVFRSLDDEKERAFSDCVRENENRRREFLLEVCKRRLTIVDAFGLQRIKVVSPEDFEWLLAKCPGGMEFDSELDEDSLLILIDSVRNWDNPTNFECFYAAAKKWPRLWERNKLLFEGVPLDSREAHDARETQRLMRSMARDDDEELRPPPAERVEELLLAFDSGNLDAFWQLHLVLTIRSFFRSDRPRD